MKSRGHRATLLVAAMAASISLGCSATPTRTADETVSRTSAQASHASSSGRPIAWGRCTSAALRRARAQCGYLSVPMDHANPGGRQIKIAVSRVKHTTRKYQGIMLLNPGGPGGPGLELAALGRLLPRSIGGGYDWIGFDPRGVGASKPALSCRPSYFHGDRPPYVPANQQQVRTWLQRSKSYADGCRKYGALLGHMKTTDSARDMDLIREALGAKQINYYGWSYGTYLAQVYATLFPSRVRRMVLDSNVDPRRVWYAGQLDQDRAFDRAFDTFFAWIAKHHRTYRLGRTRAAVERLYFEQQRILHRRPAGPLGPSEWADSFITGTYAPVVWPDLARGFAAWVHRHDPKPLIRSWRSYDKPGNDNTFAVYIAVQCTDAPWPAQWSQWARDTRRINRTSPTYTWGNTWYNTPCLYWPAKPGTPVAVDGHDVPALLVGQTRDAATSFEGSLEVRSRFPSSRLVAMQGGTTHASTPTLSSACANARIAAYLQTGALPPRLPGRRADVTCPAPPPPSP